MPLVAMRPNVSQSNPLSKLEFQLGEGGRQCPLLDFSQGVQWGHHGAPCRARNPQKSLPSPLTSFPTTLLITHHSQATLALLYSSDRANSSPQGICTCCSPHLGHSIPDLPSHGWFFLLLQPSPEVCSESPSDVSAPAPPRWPCPAVSSSCSCSVVHNDGRCSAADLLVGLFLSAFPHLT